MESFGASRTIGSRIRAAREGLGLTIEDLAHMTEMDKTNIGRIERGASTSVRTLLMIAVALETDPGDLLRGLGFDDLPPGTRILGRDDYLAYRDEMDRQRPRFHIRANRRAR